MSDLLRDLEALQRQAGGVLKTIIVQHRDIGLLGVSAAAGDADSRSVIVSIGNALATMREAKPREAPLCACCPKSLRRTRFTFVVTIPATDAPTKALCFGICERCAPDRETAFTQARAVMLKFWPGARPIDITHPNGGRA